MKINKDQPATPIQTETYYSAFIGLLAHELADLVPTDELSERAARLLELVSQDNWRTAYNHPLTLGDRLPILDLFDQVFISPFIPNN